MNILKWILHGDYLDFDGLTLDEHHALEDRKFDEAPGIRCPFDFRQLSARPGGGLGWRCKLRAGHEGPHEDIVHSRWPRPDPCPELTQMAERYKSGVRHG